MTHLSIDETLLRDVLARLPEFVLVVDRNGVIGFINRLEPGYEIEKVVGMHCTTVMFPDSKLVMAAALEQVITDGQTTRFEVQVALPDGSLAWYASEMTPILSGTAIVGAVIRAENVTAMKAVRDELAQVKRLLRMCAWCGRIQDAAGTWEEVSTYLRRIEDTSISHGLCPRCEQQQLDALQAE